MTTKKPLIAAQGLVKTYPFSGGEVVAIQNLDFQVARGEFFCVLGPSGCGKSTLLSLVSGLDSPTAGSLHIDDHPTQAPPVDIGMVFQEHALFPWMTLERNLSFVLEHHPRFINSNPLELARTWLHKVGLEKFNQAFPHQVSGGMRQRAAIARSFAVEPSLLLMDEPFVYLDYQTRMQCQQLLLDLWQEVRCTIMFVTHDIEEAMLLADRVMIMSSRPGSRKEMISNALSRPRKLLDLKTSPDFLNLVSRGVNALRHELQTEATS